ncbi:PIN domain-containing protein [Paenibacillus sp. GbtcB18]|uniref:PIN domain-containing protein n=1 Tax=Paenibacillus sp. GbtcB18 TaxID=2824763 RepID=UPI001C300292|nr:PIN domain-containing protein [Paenibacillus sp. GbtcB18]
MKDTFAGFYQPSEEDFQKLWAECIFVFDTNSLLNIYRYPKDSRDLLLKILESLSDRIWIPHQIAYEYHRNIHGEFINQNNAYKETKEIITSATGSLRQELNKLRHSNIQVNEIIEKIAALESESINMLDNQKLSQPDLNKIKEQISAIISNKIGKEYSQAQLDEIYVEGSDRYPKEVPPGYKDLAEKKGKISYYNGKMYKDEYGDLVYWKQLLEHAKKAEVKSVILVTDDRKEDWWYKVKGQIQGPATGLVHEFNKEVQKKFYMYQTEQFIKYAREFLKLDADADMDKAIKDIQEYKNTDSEFTGQMFIKGFMELYIYEATLKYSEKMNYSNSHFQIEKEFLHILEKFQRTSISIIKVWESKEHGIIFIDFQTSNPLPLNSEKTLVTKSIIDLLNVLGSTDFELLQIKYNGCYEGIDLDSVS